LCVTCFVPGITPPSQTCFNRYYPVVAIFNGMALWPQICHDSGY
jgi:hypothetical protein